MAIGTVKFFNAAKGFGFIIPEEDGTEIFVHKTALEQAGIASLTKGQCLSFEIERGAEGAVKAVNLQPHTREHAPGVANEESPNVSTNETVPERRINHALNRRSPRGVSNKVRNNDRGDLSRNSKGHNKSNEWQQNYDRYCDLAHNAGNDSMMREHYWQHAEHFLRMMNGSST